MSLRCTTATADGRRISDICTLSSSNDLHLLPNNTVLQTINILTLRVSELRRDLLGDTISTFCKTRNCVNFVEKISRIVALHQS